MDQDSPSDQRTPRSVERELTHSRNVIANAKVVVTFSAALAATFASAALDSKKDSGWDEWAAALNVSHACRQRGRHIASR